ncbi:hypothetical protein BCT63_11020 [Vibrio kanaloae]|nr:hypothetical protein BCT63_11020 [Vibrio kanaloae]
MKIANYIEQCYGKERGAKARFLADNPKVIPSQLSRWLRCEAIIGDDGRVYISNSGIVLNLHSDIGKQELACTTKS